MAEKLVQQHLTGERALFGSSGLQIYDTVFADGESPLKECRDIELHGCMFKWKYPLWYSRNISLENCTIFEMGRAGIWYTNNISVRDTTVEAPKNFRKYDGVTLENVSFPNAAETLWNCKNVSLKNVAAHGDYFAMGCENVKAEGFTLVGNYSFDGAKNVEIRGAKMLSKDAFWNSENVTVYDSFISGEYLGWNSKRLTLVNCTIESLQGLCYAEELTLKNCKLIDTTLAFEYSTVQAEIIGRVDSVKNPSGGRITADSIGELIMESERVDPEKTEIICREGLTV